MKSTQKLKTTKRNIQPLLIALSTSVDDAEENNETVERVPIHLGRHHHGIDLMILMDEKTVTTQVVVVMTPGR